MEEEPARIEECGQVMLPLDAPSSTAPADASVNVPFPVALLALGAVRGLGTKGLRALVRTFGEQLGILWDLSSYALRLELTRAKLPAAAKVADGLERDRSLLLKTAEDQFQSLTSRGVHILGPTGLPLRLRELPDGPLWAFVEGDPAALFSGPHIAVVGTRDATPSGVRATDAAVRSLAAYPITLVSGLANGIDAAAHAAALRDGVQNVAFLGHGIDLVFPTETAEMRTRIIRTGGAVVSEYMPGEHYRKAQFVQRNRLQAGLADLVVAAEGARTGGTAHTVRFAAAYRRRIVGFTWHGAGDLIELIRTEPTGELIDIFTTDGRRKFDTLCRNLANSYGHKTFGLTLVERQLNREAQLRSLSREDLDRLRRRIDSLLEGG